MTLRILAEGSCHIPTEGAVISEEPGSVCVPYQTFNLRQFLTENYFVGGPTNQTYNALILRKETQYILDQSLQENLNFC